ncbi:MAG TPA: ABC transporter permease [Thermoanaerobaculia bacterium]
MGGVEHLPQQQEAGAVDAPQFLRDPCRILDERQRRLAKAPGHTAAAVAALSLGVGLTTATFSIVYGLLWRSMPYPYPERLLVVHTQIPARDQLHRPVDLHDYLDWRRRQRTFVDLAGVDDVPVTVSGDDRPERLDGAFLTANAFDLLGVPPLAGRTFQAGDERPGAPPVVVLGYQLWQRRYGGDPKLIGKAVRVSSHPATVIGIMPRDFSFPDDEQLWLPLALDPATHERGKGTPLKVFGRLRPGATRAAAAAEMAAIARALAAEHPRTNRGLSAAVTPLRRLEVDEQGGWLLQSLLVAVGCVLLIACINVSSLIMSRGLARSREIAVRAALGARRHQVIAQLLTESLILALLASPLGIGLAWAGIAVFHRGVVRFNPPPWIHIALDLPALACTLAVTLLAAVVSGLVPALELSRAELHHVLADQGRGTASRRLGRLSRLVVVAELALSCVLLVMAGLMWKSAARARSANLGFAVDHVLTARVPLFPARYPRPIDRGAFYQLLLDRLRQLPGVAAAGATTAVPSISSESEAFAVDGRAYASDTDYPAAHSDVVAEGTFAALGVRLLAGREFGRLDTAASQPLAIVDQSLAQALAAREPARQAPAPRPGRARRAVADGGRRGPRPAALRHQGGSARGRLPAGDTGRRRAADLRPPHARRAAGARAGGPRAGPGDGPGHPDLLRQHHGAERRRGALLLRHVRRRVRGLRRDRPVPRRRRHLRRHRLLRRAAHQGDRPADGARGAPRRRDRHADAPGRLAARPRARARPAAGLRHLAADRQRALPCPSRRSSGLRGGRGGHVLGRLARLPGPRAARDRDRAQHRSPP